MKKIISVFVSLFIASSIGLTAFAQSYPQVSPNANGAYLLDLADLLTDEEEQLLTAKIEKIKEEYNFLIVLHTTPTIGGKTISEYADDYYNYNGFNSDEISGGLLFMLNMNNGDEGNRDYYTYTVGDGITYFTDYAIGSDGYIYQQILDYLRNDDYYTAFNSYIDIAEEFIAKGESGGEPYDYSNSYKSSSNIFLREIIAVLAGVALAAVVTLFLKSKMNTAVIKHEASDYDVPGSLVVTASNDRFVRCAVSKVPINTEKPGGSSTHVGSSGTTHGGGGGKF